MPADAISFLTQSILSIDILQKQNVVHTQRTAKTFNVVVRPLVVFLVVQVKVHILLARQTKFKREAFVGVMTAFYLFFECR